MRNTLCSYQPYSIRSSAIVTNSYVAGTIIQANTSGDIFDKSQLLLLVNVTLGSLTTADIKVEFSPDGTNYYQETYDAIGTATASAVTITESLIQRSFAASGSYRIAIPILDAFIRISTKGTGTVTSSLVAITAIVGNN